VSDRTTKRTNNAQLAGDLDSGGFYTVGILDQKFSANLMYKYQDFIIRNWQKSDHSIVLDIIKSIRLEYGVMISKSYDQDTENVTQIEQYYLEAGGLFWVLEKHNKILGAAAFYPCKEVEKGAEIKKLYLLPQARGIGLGKFLLQQLELEITIRGFHTILIQTVNLFQEAVSLYENNGYIKLLELEIIQGNLTYYKIISDL
jgi:putative acetyltransferase